MMIEQTKEHADDDRKKEHADDDRTNKGACR